MTSSCIDLISNYYRVYSNDHDLTETLFQYEIEVELSHMSHSGDVGEHEPPSFIKQMSDQQNIPVEWRRKIVSVAVDKWLASAENSEDQFVKCSLDCNKLIANFGLFEKKENDSDDIEFINVPYCHGNLHRSTLVFSVRPKKTTLGYLTLLNIALGADGRSGPTLVDQSATSTTTYNAEEQVRPACSTLFVRGQTIQMKSLAFGPALSICNTSCSLHKPLGKVHNLVDYLRDKSEVTEFDWALDPSDVSYLNQKLAGRRVEVTHIKLLNLPLRVRIHEIVGTAHDRICSIRDHFANNLGIELKYPNLPCVVFYSGQERHEIPMELCQLFVDERGLARELAPGQQSKSEIKPLDYFERVERQVKCLADSNDSDLKELGVSIDTQPMRVIGQVFEPVALVGTRGRDGFAHVDQKCGQYDLSKASFWRPVKLRKFSITLVSTTKALTSEYDNLKEFIVEYCRVGGEKEVGISRLLAQIDIVIQESEKSLKETLKRHVEQLNKQSFDHSIMVLAEDCQHICSYVHFLETQFKYSPNQSTRLSCLELSYLKQSLDDAKNKNDTLMQNLWMKFNSQLGGMNYRIDSSGFYSRIDLLDDLLVLGVSICHADPDDRFSVLAVVGMWSSGCDRSHSTQLQVQSTNCGDESTCEQVVDVGSMVRRILCSYYPKSWEKSLPNKVIIVLEGTLDGRFKMTEGDGSNNIPQIMKEAYAKIWQAGPDVSCFEIQQRHDVRFRLSSPIKVEGEDDYQIPSGTIIADSNLFGHNGFAFHAAPNSDCAGTVEPPIARKLQDGISSMTDRDYQRLFLALCCISTCSTKCTSVPAPVDLAERASRRGKDIALVWREECFSGGNFIEQLNEYFKNLSGSSAYHETLFYV